MKDAWQIEIFRFPTNPWDERLISMVNQWVNKYMYIYIFIDPMGLKNRDMFELKIAEKTSSKSTDSPKRPNIKQFV